MALNFHLANFQHKGRSGPDSLPITMSTSSSGSISAHRRTRQRSQSSIIASSRSRPGRRRRQAVGSSKTSKKISTWFIFNA